MSGDVVLTLLCGMMAIMAAAGFTMLNAGLCRAHASASICLMGFGGCAIAAIAFYFLGHNLMYRNVGDYSVMGSFGFFYSQRDDSASEWFFRMAQAALASTIVLGALAERVKITPYLLFTAVFAAVIFPIPGAWVWGGGWLNQIGFHDYGGSAVIHLAAGCAALAGIYYVGPRAGRYAPDGKPIPFPGSNIPLATLGAFLVFMGWPGIVAGHGDVDVGVVFMNAALAGAGGCVATLVYVNLRYPKPDVTIVINGAIAGLVAVSAGVDAYSPFFAMLVGCVGGVLCAYVIPLLDQRKLDDPVGVVPVHLVGGAWGTLAGVFVGNPFGQLLGFVLIAAFSGGLSVLTWRGLKKFGVRCADRSLRHGVDVCELGLEAYPDFPVRTAGRPDITQIDKF